MTINLQIYHTTYKFDVRVCQNAGLYPTARVNYIIGDVSA